MCSREEGTSSRHEVCMHVRMSVTMSMDKYSTAVVMVMVMVNRVGILVLLHMFVMHVAMVMCHKDEGVVVSSASRFVVVMSVRSSHIYHPIVHRVMFVMVVVMIMLRAPVAVCVGMARAMM